MSKNQEIGLCNDLQIIKIRLFISHLVIYGLNRNDQHSEKPQAYVLNLFIVQNRVIM